MSAKAIIFGCSGTYLGTDERRFFEQSSPWGFILFARNLRNEDQTRRLINELKETVGHEPHIFIDEEGGRVSRLRSLGGWIGPPAADFLRKNPDMELCAAAIRDNYRAIGARLAALGFTADCAPVLDVPVQNADPVIGDRAFSYDHKQIASLAKACIAGLKDAGICHVIKHIPGHGRADVDSHKSLPVVTTSHAQLSATDFLPFQQLSSAQMAMSAHVVYSDIDPHSPATTSKTVISDIIRKEIGFDGLLMSDDLDMKALSGSLSERAQKSLLAGCDMLLHCSGDLKAMKELDAVTPILGGRSLERAKQAAPLSPTCQINPENAIIQAQRSFTAFNKSMEK